MKRIVLLRKLREQACVFDRPGGGHDIWRNVITGKSAPVPRHREINDFLARAILRQLSPPPDSGNN